MGNAEQESTSVQYTCAEHAPEFGAIELPHHVIETPVFATTAEEEVRPAPTHDSAVGRTPPPLPVTRVLRWAVSADERSHPMGCGPVLLVVSRSPRCVEVFTRELDLRQSPRLSAHANVPTRRAQVYGTAEPVPITAQHVGSALDAGNHGVVWHVFALD